MEFELLSGEQLLHQGPASRRYAVDDPTIPLPRKRKKLKQVAYGNLPVKGTLYLTNNRLIHVGVKGEPVILFHEDIEDVQASNVEKSVTNVLTVDSASGRGYDFFFDEHPEWKLIFPVIINRAKHEQTGS